MFWLVDTSASGHSRSAFLASQHWDIVCEIFPGLGTRLKELPETVDGGFFVVQKLECEFDQNDFIDKSLVFGVEVGVLRVELFIDVFDALGEILNRVVQLVQ